MLDKVIMLPFTMFLLFLFAFFAVTGIGLFNHWTMVQNQAQFIASSISKWGDYTSEAQDSVEQFANDLNISHSQVNVSTSGGKDYGEPVWVEISIPYKLKVGRFNAGTFTLTGTGRAVSVYIPGSYSP